MKLFDLSVFVLSTCLLYAGAEGSTVHRREVESGRNISCGVGKQSRIVGGDQARPEEFPWQVAFRKETNISRSGIFCGGSLIGKKWVVTAAHCLDEKSLKQDELRVVLGEFDVWNEDGNEMVVAVKNVIIHPGYENRLRQNEGCFNDIALVELESEVSFNDYMKPVCLPKRNINFSPGKICKVTGFGRVVRGGVQSMTLRKANAPIVDNLKCAQLYGPTVLDQSTVCAGFNRRNQNSCQGDSGGPLVCQKNGQFYLTGVVSWGTSRCVSVTVYTNVAFYMDWIEKTTCSGANLLV